MLSACGPDNNPQTFLQSFTQSPDALADKALAALVHGDYAAAEENVDAALAQNPRNVYALLAGGLLYQNTNRPLRARTMYEELLAQRPAQTATIMGWNHLSPSLLSDIASQNLQNVESSIGQGGVYQQPPAVYGASANSGAGPSVTSLSAVAPQVVRAYSAPQPRNMQQAIQPLSPQLQAVADRFMVLRKLRDAQLISPQEYTSRRNVNIGGLLPLTKSPPGIGLDRPVPEINQVVDRLMSLQQSLQGRSITPREHAIERQLILDALMPEKPEALAHPQPAPKGLLASAERVRQLDHLRSLGLITKSEMQNEQRAVEKALQVNSPMQKEGATDPKMLIPGTHVKAQTHAAPVAKSLAKSVTVHLSSYRSKAMAQKGWETLRKRYKNELGTMAADIRRTSVPGRGNFYRLYVGPLDNKAAATKLCSSLRRKKQFCSVSSK